MSIVLSLFRASATGNATLEIACIGYSVLGNTEVQCDTGFSIDTFYVNKLCHFCYSIFLPLLGVLSGVKAP